MGPYSTRNENQNTVPPRSPGVSDTPIPLHPDNPRQPIRRKLLQTYNSQIHGFSHGIHGVLHSGHSNPAVTHTSFPLLAHAGHRRPGSVCTKHVSSQISQVSAYIHSFPGLPRTSLELRVSYGGTIVNGRDRSEFHRVS